MRIQIRQALKEYEGAIAVVCGAWHLSALRAPAKTADDKALINSLPKDLPKIKVEATWVPWTDSRLSYRSGYGAGVLSPGWYRHLWSLYGEDEAPTAEQFASLWQAKTASMLRKEGYPAPQLLQLKLHGWRSDSLHCAACKFLDLPKCERRL